MHNRCGNVERNRRAEPNDVCYNFIAKLLGEFGGWRHSVSFSLVILFKNIMVALIPRRHTLTQQKMVNANSHPKMLVSKSLTLSTLPWVLKRN